MNRPVALGKMLIWSDAKGHLCVGIPYLRLEIVAPVVQIQAEVNVHAWGGRITAVLGMGAILEWTYPVRWKPPVV
jgi:hypothetical protein